MSRHLELEALASVAALAQVSISDALATIDEVRIGADDWTHPLASRLAGLVEARLRSNLPLDYVALRELLGITGSESADLLYEVLTTGSPLLVAEHLTLVRDRALRARCVEALRKSAAVLRDESRPTSEVVSEVQSLVALWEARGNVAPSMAGDVDGLLAELDDVYNGRRQPVLPTGIEALDAVIGGLQPTLTVVGGLPGVGKSALVAAIVRNLAVANTKCGLVSLEDDRGWLVRRLVSDFSGIGVHSMLTKRLSMAAMEAIGDATAKAHGIGKNILIDGRPRQTPAEVVASARYMLSQGAKALLVDHLGEIAVDYNSSTPADRIIGNALGELRALATSYKVPVVVMAHLNRQVGTEFDEPRAQHFAFSEAVARMARVALGLYRSARDDGERDPYILKCAVMKQTNGIAGVNVTLRLKPASAVVTHSPAPAEAKRLYGGDE